MAKISRLAMLAAAALALAPLAAQAQGKAGLTYRCTGKDGKRYYSSTIPRQCYGELVEQLNAQGMVVKRFDPEGEEKARAAKEAEAAKKREEAAARREEDRRNRALLATYTSAQDIEEARKRALDAHGRTQQEVELRIEALRKRRALHSPSARCWARRSALSRGGQSLFPAHARVPGAWLTRCFR